jgi:hypothetical protein
VRKVLDLDTSLSSDDGDMRARGSGLKGMGALIGGLSRKRIAGSEQRNCDFGGTLHPGKDGTHQKGGGTTGSGSVPRKNVTNNVEAADQVFDARSPGENGRDAWTGATVFLGDGGFEIIEEITVYHVSRVFVSMSACVCERFRGNLQNALRRRLQCKLKCLHVLMPIQLSRTENEALRGEIDSLQTQLREMQQREKDHLTNCRKLQFQKQVCCCFRPIGS